MENGNLNLEMVARGMTPKFGHEESESTIMMATRVRLARNIAGDYLHNALPIVERVATSVQHLGKPKANADDLAVTLGQLEAMPEAHQRYLSIASYVAKDAPASEHEDWQQEIYLVLSEEHPKDIKLAWAIAHRTQIDCYRNWRRYHSHVEPMSSPAPYALEASDPYVENTLEDVCSEIGYLDDEYDYIESRIDSKRAWEALNVGKHVKGILDKRIRGEALASRDRVYLHRFLASHKAELAVM